ncbi:hypothetical protein [Streptomyces fuscichromogenes]|uniref:Uncharacterized protein n=1 Tax=Streptomyces fuscichromogenes TaxID=1324013 RepID=A0A917XHU3_9ACTN|nr:hypothetical protein [Streptomyces fuscichromogenes]GGN28029.1 hypothetical protein GCM10011578_063780 [Streptomyces fuscichromogenes]
MSVPAQPSAPSDEQVEEALRAKLAVKSLDKWFKALEALTAKAAAEINQRPTTIQAPGKHIERWYGTFALYLETGQTPPFFAARYGYAVETLVTAKIRNDEDGILHTLPPGWSVRFQVSHGTTRPDIVVVDEKGKEYGWYDITSEASRGHIDSKIGSGWRTRGHVGEACYPTLDPDTLAKKSDETMYDRRRVASALKKEQERLDAATGILLKHVRGCSDNMPASIQNNKEHKRAYVEKALYVSLSGVLSAMDYLVTDGKLRPVVAKSLLGYLDKSWLTHFGYTGEHAQGGSVQYAVPLLDELA